MFTAVVLCFIAYLFWRAHVRYNATGAFVYRRAKAQWSWAFIGGAVGSFFGVAGFGNAIIGTLPAALLGYLLSGYLMLKQQAGERLHAPAEIASAATHVATGAAGLAGAAARAARNSAGPAVDGARRALTLLVKVVGGMALAVGLFLGIIFAASSFTQSGTSRADAQRSTAEAPVQESNEYALVLSELRAQHLNSTQRPRATGPRSSSPCFRAPPYSEHRGRRRSTRCARRSARWPQAGVRPRTRQRLALGLLTPQGSSFRKTSPCPSASTRAS